MDILNSQLFQTLSFLKRDNVFFVAIQQELQVIDIVTGLLPQAIQCNEDFHLKLAQIFRVQDLPLFFIDGLWYLFHYQISLKLQRWSALQLLFQLREFQF